MLSSGDWAAIATRLLLATLIGLALGFEREWRGHDAGLRTHAIVALSSAVITISAVLIAGNDPHLQSDPLRAVQGLAQAIGFIAGGLIFIRGGDVRNMTTATTLWLSAAMGIAAGAGQYVLLALAAAIGLGLMTIVKLLERVLTRHKRDDADNRLKLPNRRGAIDRGDPR